MATAAIFPGLDAIALLCTFAGAAWWGLRRLDRWAHRQPLHEIRVRALYTTMLIAGHILLFLAVYNCRLHQASLTRPTCCQVAAIAWPLPPSNCFATLLGPPPLALGWFPARFRDFLIDILLHLVVRPLGWQFTCGSLLVAFSTGTLACARRSSASSLERSSIVLTIMYQPVSRARS